MALSKTKQVLIHGLKRILTNQDTILALALMLETDEQMEVMIAWIWDHQKENPSENRVIRIAKAIVKELPSEEQGQTEDSSQD